MWSQVALGSTLQTKLVKMMEFQLSYFKSWKLWKCCTHYVSKFGKLSSGHRTRKGWSVFIPIPKKGNTKEYSNYYTIALISHASKVILKILQARLQQYVNWELSDVQDGFRKEKAGEPEIKLPTFNHRKSKRCSATCPWFQNFYVSWLLPLLSHSSFSKLSETLSPGLQSSFYPI